MSSRIRIAKCQRRLAAVWLLGAGLLVSLMVAQSFGQKFGSHAEEAWGWLLALVSPILLLIIGVVAAEARKPRPKATVDRFAYKVSLGLSVFYLVLVALTPTVEPLTQLSPLETMRVSNLWLAPLHGLVGLALGAFFQSKEG